MIIKLRGFPKKITYILNKIWNWIDPFLLSEGHTRKKNTKYKCSNEADHKMILLSRSLCHGNMVPLLDIIINQRPEPAKPQRQTV